MMRVPISLLAAVWLTTAASAQSAESRQTRDFVQAASQSDQFEILEAHTALAESRDPHVRAFAQQMIAAHQGTSDRLSQTVAKAGLEQPLPGVSGDQSMFLASLQSQRGADFDRTYVKQQMLAHHAALAVQQGYASTGDVAALRKDASTTTATISAHLRMAERLQSSIGGE